jgi:hypothetical protein
VESQLVELQVKMEQMSIKHTETLSKVVKEKEQLVKEKLDLKQALMLANSQNEVLKSELELGAAKLVQNESLLEAERIKI